jgi:hypothetical protein
VNCSYRLRIRFQAFALLPKTSAWHEDEQCRPSVSVCVLLYMRVWTWALWHETHERGAKERREKSEGGGGGGEEEEEEGFHTLTALHQHPYRTVLHYTVLYLQHAWFLLTAHCSRADLPPAPARHPSAQRVSIASAPTSTPPIPSHPIHARVSTISISFVWTPLFASGRSPGNPQDGWRRAQQLVSDPHSKRPNSYWRHGVLTRPRAVPSKSGLKFGVGFQHLKRLLVTPYK